MGTWLCPQQTCTIDATISIARGVCVEGRKRSLRPIGEAGKNTSPPLPLALVAHDRSISANRWPRQLLPPCVLDSLGKAFWIGCRATPLPAANIIADGSSTRPFFPTDAIALHSRLRDHLIVRPLFSRKSRDGLLKVCNTHHCSHHCPCEIQNLLASH